LHIQLTIQSFLTPSLCIPTNFFFFREEDRNPTRICGCCMNDTSISILDRSFPTHYLIMNYRLKKIRKSGEEKVLPPLICESDGWKFQTVEIYQLNGFSPIGNIRFKPFSFQWLCFHHETRKKYGTNPIPIKPPLFCRKFAVFLFNFPIFL